MNTNSVPVTMKESHENIYNALINEIAVPAFYSEISDIDEIEIVQGKSVVNPPHYEKKE